MNIKQISMGLIGTAMMAGFFSSCRETKYEDKAKAQAVKYLRGDELLKAERFAHQQTNYDKYNGEAITYWDSLLVEAKANEAYQRGYSLVKDSLNGIHHRKEKFKAPLDTICSDNVIEDVISECAKYSSAEEFIKARNNAPESYVTGTYNSLAASTHYWNLITIAGRQKEAYNQGMADARNELSKSKLEIPQMSSFHNK